MPKTLVAVNQYPAFRSSSNFDSPDTFRPERFLTGNAMKGDNLSIFQPFGMGRQQCIGFRLAWALMRLTLASLLFSFDVELVDDTKGGNWGEQKTFIFWEKDPIVVKLKARAI